VPPEAIRVIVVEALATTFAGRVLHLHHGLGRQHPPEAPEAGWVVKTNLVAVP